MRLTLTTAQRRRLERQLKETLDARVYRRTLAVLDYARGRAIVEIAEEMEVTPQSVYNWIEAYARAHDPTALDEGARSGRPGVWNPEQSEWLRALMETTPDRFGYFAMNWTVPLLKEQLDHGTGRRFSDDAIRRELKRQGYAWKRPRYVLAPDPDREKKTVDSALDSAPAARESSSGRR